jgi:hypothetical protein
MEYDGRKAQMKVKIFDEGGKLTCEATVIYASVPPTKLYPILGREKVDSILLAFQSKL